jgi:hypothetical protein
MKAGITLCAGLTLLLLFVVQGIFFIRANSQTYDEAMHIAAGYSYLTKRDFRIEPQNPPLMKELQALPIFLIHKLPFDPDPQQWRDGNGYLIGRDFLYKSTLSADHMLFLSRLPNLRVRGPGSAYGTVGLPALGRSSSHIGHGARLFGTKPCRSLFSRNHRHGTNFVHCSYGVSSLGISPHTDERPTRIRTGIQSVIDIIFSRQDSEQL